MDDEHDFFAGIQIETPCIPKGCEGIGDWSLLEGEVFLLGDGRKNLLARSALLVAEMDRKGFRGRVGGRSWIRVGGVCGSERWGPPRACRCQGGALGVRLAVLPVFQRARFYCSP